MSDRPLAAASVRLRGRPGRPRAADDQSSAPGPRPVVTRTSIAAVAETWLPRLLDVEGAAAYLSVSTWTIRDLESAGELRRVRLPLTGRDVRRLLFDRADLDRLVDRAKA